MKTQIVVTDLTRMQEGRVCVAGYDEQGRCVRPVLPPPGILECSLYLDGQAVIFPFAVVTYNFVQHSPHPPHTEDILYDPSAVLGCGAVSGGERRALLCRSLSPSVASIFEQPLCVEDGHPYVAADSGPRSLGTVLISRSPQVLFQSDASGMIKPRLLFEDGAGAPYQLAVTDLTWRYYADFLQRTEKLPGNAVAVRLQAALQGAEVFLRIGLARGWSAHSDRCYLQVTGVHTFPDYLGGRTFADFAPPPEEDDW